ncbi:MAG: hypothetical protein ACI8QC_000464 [Planctomycetota bacterium]|jgi:hypothetical protein
MRLAHSLLVCSALATQLQAQCSEVKLLASDGDTLDRFGYSIGIDGDTMIVPAKHDEFPLADQGTAYVFDWNGSAWIESQRLAASDAQAGALFGWASHLNGDDWVVGATLHDGAGTNSGKVYAFERSAGSWTETQGLEAADAAAQDFFGRAVAVSGDYLVVGAPQQDSAGTNAGCVYVFERSAGTWAQVQQLFASDGAAEDRFGWGLDLDGDRLVVGAYLHDAGSTDRGAVYVFDLVAGSFSESAKLVPADATGEFGWDLSLDGDLLAVGAPADAFYGQRSGAGYLYEHSAGTWSERLKFLAADGETFDRAGTSVAIEGTRMLVSSFLDDDMGSSSGSIYMLEEHAGAFSVTHKLTASDGLPGDQFGRYISLSAGRLAAAGLKCDDLGADSGAAYVFELPTAFVSYCYCDAGPCGNDESFSGCTTSAGAGAVLAGCGSASLAADDLVLTASGVPANQFGLMFMGGAEHQSPLGDGQLCVNAGSQGLYRFNVDHSGPSGELVWGPGLSAYAASSLPAGAMLSAGATWNFQVWFRDPAGPCGSGNGTTNAVAVTFAP